MKATIIKFTSWARVRRGALSLGRIGEDLSFRKRFLEPRMNTNGHELNSLIRVHSRFFPCSPFPATL